LLSCGCGWRFSLAGDVRALQRSTTGEPDIK
jgi:hypothetical protein